MTSTVHPVDEVLPVPKLLPSGLQHVLVMYAGAVAVPLIIGRALSLPPEEVAHPDQRRPVRLRHRHPDPVGRLPRRRHPAAGDDGRHLRLGRPDAGDGRQRRCRPARHLRLGHRRRHLRRAVAPFVSRLLPLFPPVVTGTIILVIGISLMRVGINWAGGGLPTLTKVIDGQAYSFANPAYGELDGW